MKTIKKDDGSVDGARVALLLDWASGWESWCTKPFFLVGGAIAVGALTVATANIISGACGTCPPGSSTSLLT